MVVFWFSFPEETPNNGDGMPPKQFKNSTVSWSILPSVDITGGAIRSSTRRCTADSATVDDLEPGGPGYGLKVNTDISKQSTPGAAISHEGRSLRIHRMMLDKQQRGILKLLYSNQKRYRSFDSGRNILELPGQVLLKYGVGNTPYKYIHLEAVT